MLITGEYEHLGGKTVYQIATSAYKNSAVFIQVQGTSKLTLIYF